MDWVARKFTVCNYNTMSGVKPAGSSNASRASILWLELALWANLKGRTARYKSTTKPFRRLSWIALLLSISVLLVPLQSQAQSITYGGVGFTENSANDGSVNGSITATLSGDSYVTPLDISTDVTLGNIPMGLVPSLNVELGATNWAARVVPEPNHWRSVTYGNGQFVAVAIDGTNRVMTSPDGFTWTAQAAAEANGWSSVTYGNGKFVAVAGNGTNRVMTSPDGITWTVQAASDAHLWLSVSYGNGTFVAVGIRELMSNGTNLVMTSPDGITWTGQAPAEQNQWFSVAYGNDLFVAVASNGTNRVMTSPDGVIWTAKAASEGNSWSSVTYGNGLFVAVARNNTNQVMTALAYPVATLTLSGNADTHAEANDVSDITFDFADSAFGASLAASVSNATGPASSNIGVDFNAPPNITYGGGFIETSANDGSVTGSLTATLSGARPVARSPSSSLLAR